MFAKPPVRSPWSQRAIFWCAGLFAVAAALYMTPLRGVVVAAAPAGQSVATSVGTLDTVHYIPPLYAVSGYGTGGNNINRHYLALSTPSVLPVAVTVSTKSGLSQVVEISRGAPKTVELSATTYGSIQYGARGIVNDSGLNTVNTTDGFILTADVPFYATIRHEANLQAESLTAKGQTALGTRFRAGFMRASEVATQNTSDRSHFISVMASQDNTVVSFDNLHADLVFSGVTGTPAPVTLNRGESYVIGVRFADIAANRRNALNGALITATKPVAMNSGSWMSGGGNEDVGNGQDIGFDQSLPASLVGTDYILSKGLASGVSANVLEVPIVIADSDNTQVFLNGGATPTVTLNAGQFAQIPGSQFVGDTMYIRASRPVYVYQTTAGENLAANIGMSLAVALSDAIEPQEVVIGDVGQLGAATMSIIVPTGAPVTLTCSAACPLGAPTAVTGIAGFEVRRQSVNGDVSVTSPDPMFISVITVNGAATSAAYFSGVPNTYAVDDTAVTALNTPVVIPVMANDNTGAGTFTLASITNALNGHVVGDVANGTVTYTPDTGFSGEDSFDYAITSGSISSTATVTVTVLPNVYNFTQSAFQVLQPPSATTTNVVTVVREGDLSVEGAISVSLFPGAGTPATPGLDYLDGPIALQFPVGASTATVPITLLHDPTNTTDETISLALTGAGVGQTLPTATLTLVLVAPNTPPTVTVPSNVTVEATGPSGAAVPFTATGDDAEDGAITPVCAPVSGATFALGTTTVSCTVTDRDGATASATFTVTVVDTTAPTIASMSDVTEPGTSASGAVVTYTPPATSDLVSGSGVASCTPTSGSTFPFGATPVLCVATDAAGNTASSIFTVTVTNTPPTFTPPVGTLEGFLQQAYVKASNTGTSDEFGWAVAVSGDTMVVGARFEDSHATGVNGDEGDNSLSNAGAAYVFVRTGATWAQQAYLKASNPGANNQFGSAVAVFGDTVVVGAVGQANSAGAAYVFVRSGTSWSEQAFLKASNAGAGDRFGTEVAISGDTIVVGAPEERSIATGVNGDQANNDAFRAGAAYVFVRSGTTWAQQAYLKASNTAAEHLFGAAVAVSGDTVVVGAYWENSNATGVDGDEANNDAFRAGAAYVFVRSGTAWAQQAYLKASNSDANDLFGRAVAVSGDTVVVSALWESSNATGVNGNEANNSAGASGAAYVFVRTDSTWAQQAYLKASNTNGGDRFGTSVAVEGDTVVVGAQWERSTATGVNGNEADNGAVDAGAAYVFARSGTTWAQQAYLKASNTRPGDLFGFAVAISGDTVVVGARLEDSGATGVNGDGMNNDAVDSGAAYVFLLQAELSRVEATSGAGAVVTFAATGDDAEDGPITPVCAPASGDIFSLGTTQVSCTVTDSAGATASGTFEVTVVDTTAPSIAATGDLVEVATSGAGAAVTYTAPATSDVVDGTGTATCLPASGSTFALGTTTVTCTATDAAGNSASATFTVTVTNNAPTFTAPADETVEASSAAGGWLTFTATGYDVEDGAIVAVCSPSSGAFPFGTTVVSCTVTDSAGATASGTFEVTVVDTTAPGIKASVDISVPATSPAGAMVTYPTPDANDTVDGAIEASCLPASGSTFALGTTTVTCTATDAAGNSASSTFTVTVTNNAPTFTAPANVTAEATSASGAAVTFTALGDDVEDGPIAAVCSPASGSTFALGTTTVECTVTDVAGATASGSFTVTVIDVSSTVVTCPASVMYTSAAIEACTATTTSFGGLDVAVPVTYTNNVSVGTATASASYAGDAGMVGSADDTTFAITPAPLSVTANSYTRSYLAADPVLDGTLTGVLGGDGITATYSSTGTGSQVPGVYPTVPALVDPNGKLGNYTVSSTNGTLTITNTAPVCSIVPSITSIWPPNHQLVSVTASGATDVDGGPLTYTVVAIFQDEPTNSTGDGNTAIDGFGVGTSTAQVRAERVGGGNGRVYHITWEVTDSLGLSCQATTKVGVPHDQRPGSVAVDDGPIYNSTVAGPVTPAAPKGKGGK